MSKKVIFVIIFSLFILGGGSYLLFNDSGNDTNTSTQSNSQNTTSQTQQSPDTPTTETTASDAAGPITTDQVALHNSPTDCWTIIEGNVYDITSYIPRHQGGNNILSACGTDGTAFFNGQQAGQAGGTNVHSSNAQNILSTFKIGTLN